jgi:hypothetical protein
MCRLAHEMSFATISAGTSHILTEDSRSLPQSFLVTTASLQIPFNSGFVTCTIRRYIVSILKASLNNTPTTLLSVVNMSAQFTTETKIVLDRRKRVTSVII